MSRRTERAFLGVLSFAGAVVVLVVVMQLAARGGTIDVAVRSVAGTEAFAPASPSGLANPGAASDIDEAQPASLPVTSSSIDSLVEKSSTTAVEVTTSPSESTVHASVTTSTSTSTSTPSSSAPLEGSAESTTTSPQSASSSLDGESVTTPASETATSESVVSSPSSSVVPELSELEREIVQLTNELRANPTGPLRRIDPMPECVLEGDDIVFDADTGHPEPVRKLFPNQSVSAEMSRAWSQHMAEANEMTHRSKASQKEIYASLGIDWAARGENVAWAVGYEPEDVAELFFEGWRESDGHYCNMMSGAFTHIGIGHVRTDEGKDYATQNFYRPR